MTNQCQSYTQRFAVAKAWEVLRLVGWANATTHTVGVHSIYA